jgi:hypothetical protein
MPALQSEAMFEPHGRVIPILALATAGCLWGTGFFFGKIALTEMPVAAMILFRLAFACIGLMPIIFWDRPHFDRHEWGWVFAASALGVPVLYLVQFKGLSLMSKASREANNSWSISCTIFSSIFHSPLETLPVDAKRLTEE